MNEWVRIETAIRISTDRSASWKNGFATKILNRFTCLRILFHMKIIFFVAFNRKIIYPDALSFIDLCIDIFIHNLSSVKWTDEMEECAIEFSKINSLIDWTKWQLVNVLLNCLHWCKIGYLWLVPYDRFAEPYYAWYYVLTGIDEAHTC